MTGHAAEAAARASYGRLIALLASRTRDLPAAEDALSDALVAALTQWPVSGVPANPDAWLLTAARRRVIDQHRRQATRRDKADAVERMVVDLAERPEGDVFRDERLRLLFVCTHPAIDPLAQVPLMLQVVLGLDAAHVASALRVAPKTMGQRLWRAKTKIREAGIPFEPPPPRDLPERVQAVLEAIYVAFGTAWEDLAGTDVRTRDLTAEALFLGRLVVELLPEEAEAHGLLALMLLAEARRPARRDDDGQYVPLDAQDPARWDRAAIDEAERTLRRAFALGRIGAFQLEAAIQSAHVRGGLDGRRDTEGILALYDGLVRLAPSLGAQVGRAAALLDARGGDAALQALDAIVPRSVAEDYQPWWAVRGAALAAEGRRDEADDAYDRAIGMTEDPSVRRFLLDRRAELRR